MDDADGEYELAIAAYAEGLRAVYQPVRDSLQAFARRADDSFDYTAVSRFLSGDRVAPPEFIDCLAVVRRAVSVPLPEAEQAELRALWLAVMKRAAIPITVSTTWNMSWARSASNCWTPKGGPAPTASAWRPHGPALQPSRRNWTRRTEPPPA